MVMIWVIFWAMASPMPLIEVNFSAGISVRGVGNFSMVKAAEEYDFDLKLFSPWMSMSLERRENWSAMKSFVTGVVMDDER